MIVDPAPSRPSPSPHSHPHTPAGPGGAAPWRGSTGAEPLVGCGARPRRRVVRMLRVFLAHTPEMFAGYYGDRALAALRAVAEVVRNHGERAAVGRRAGRGRRAAARRSSPTAPRPAPPRPSPPRRTSSPSCARGGHPTIDIAAASAAGVLVTRRDAGLRGRGGGTRHRHDGGPRARRVGRSRPPIAPGGVAGGADGAAASRRTLGLSAMAASRGALAEIALAMRHARAGARPAWRRSTTRASEGVRWTELLAARDVVICLAIIDAATRHLFDAAALGRDAARRASS